MALFLLLLLLLLPQSCLGALTSRILFGAVAEFVTLAKSNSASAATSQNASLAVGAALGVPFDMQLLDVAFATWQPSTELTSLVRAAVTANADVATLVVVRSALASTAAVDTSRFTALCTRVGQFLASALPIGARVFVVLEPEFSANAALRSAGSSWAAALAAGAAELKRVAPGASVGSGWLVTRTAALNEQLAEFRALVTSGTVARAGPGGLDFIAPLWRFAAPSSNTRRLNVLPCHVQTLARLATAELRLETLVLLDITNPPSDTVWLAANIQLADDLRGAAGPLYFDGVRGIALRAVVCAAGGVDTTACAVRVDRTSTGAGVENTLSLKGDTQAWRSWMLNERTATRTPSLSAPPPRFTCGAIMPLKSGLVYLDALTAWDSDAWGWVDKSTPTLLRDFYSVENVHDGKTSLRVRFDQTGQRLRFEYRSAWPLSPLLASEFSHLVFDIYAEGWAPIDLPISVRVSDQGSVVPLSTVAVRIFGADAWQRIVIPTASLLSSPGAAADAVTFTVTAPPARPIVLFLDRVAFDATALPCDFTQPHLGCNPLVLAPSVSTPAPTMAARCGNGVVEGDELCDGGACCVNCQLKPAGLPCNAARAGDQCDLPDTCDGMSGGCTDKLKPVGTACNDADDRCTSNDRCRSNGKCAGDFTCPCGGSDVLCELDLDRCTTDKCATDNKCVSTPTIGGIMCDDRDPCTSNDVCDGQGNCRGKPGLCSKQTPRPPAVGPPAGCKPGQSHLCTCQLPDDYCAPPLTCRDGICYRPDVQTAKPCALADWGKMSGCPCEPPPSLYCRPPLTCDAATETCTGGGGGSAAATTTAAGLVAPSSATRSAVARWAGLISGIWMLL